VPHYILHELNQVVPTAITDDRCNTRYLAIRGSDIQAPFNSVLAHFKRWAVCMHMRIRYRSFELDICPALSTFGHTHGVNVVRPWIALDLEADRFVPQRQCHSICCKHIVPHISN
jgi:hypothetical protein